ncbi:TetR/AcrR family transcriptional regulator [Saccharopolyspora cebuensis]|uniref:TetR/AcrR family transcriptional regulator n=1 Tax=Saccharopolyspora cebuensis TaxID=418759 RepID=A0ABV4CKS6_9PSEU
MAGRGPYAKTAATREQALDAALRIIAERGLSGTTVQEIADAVGMTKAGLLYHFGSREALLTAVLARREGIEVLGGEHGVLDGFVAALRANTSVPGLVALYSVLAGSAGSADADSEQRRYFAARYPLLRRVLAAEIEREQRAGGIPAERDPAALASLFIAAADGLQNQWLLDPDIDVAAHLELLADLVRT